MGKVRKIGVGLVILLALALGLLPPIAAFAAEAPSPPEFSGYLMDVAGTSKNGHFTAKYAWLSGDDLEVFVAFKINFPYTAANKDVVNLSYNGVTLFSGDQLPQENIDYWKLKNGLTVNNEKLGFEKLWLVVSFGPQTLSDPMTVGMSIHPGTGFSVPDLKIQITLHTVTYDANGGAGVLTDPHPIYWWGQRVTVLHNNNAFTRAGYSFTGWNTNADGSGTAYSGGDTFCMPCHDVVLYAQWAPRTLTITAQNTSKVYGEEFTGYDYRVDGIDDAYPFIITSVTFTSAGAAQYAGVGSYPIVPSNAIGEGLENYQLVYVDGTLTVDPASLTITANHFSKVYDGVAYSGGNGVTYSGFAGSEDESVLGGVLTFTGDSQGAVNAGNYVLTPGGLTSDNYAISFVDGKLEISKAALTITANDFSKVYDGVAYTGGNGVTYSGFRGSEDESVLGGALTFTGDSQGAVNVGNYVITPGGLTSDNYAISFVDGKLEITQEELPKTGANEYIYYILGLIAMLLGIVFAAKSKKLTNG